MTDMIIDAEITDERFTLDTEEKVNWLLRKIANLEAEKARVQAQADTLLRQIETDRQGLLYRFEEDLKAYAQKKIEETGNRRKSITLLQGTLSFRTVPASVKVTDPSFALTYATENAQEAVKTSVTLDTAKYRQLAEAKRQETGELLPGCDIEPERESFSLKFGKS